jgi:hypothetical protein
MNLIFVYVALDVYIFSYELCKLYASLSLMLFIAPLMNFSVTPCAP